MPCENIEQRIVLKSLIKCDNANNMYICSGWRKRETVMYSQRQNHIIESREITSYP